MMYRGQMPAFLGDFDDGIDAVGQQVPHVVRTANPAGHSTANANDSNWFDGFHGGSRLTKGAECKAGLATSTATSSPPNAQIAGQRITADYRSLSKEHERQNIAARRSEMQRLRHS